MAYLSLHAVFRDRTFFFLDVPELLEKGCDVQYITYVRNNHTVAYGGNDRKGPFIFTPGTSWTRVISAVTSLHQVKIFGIV